MTSDNKTNIRTPLLKDKKTEYTSSPDLDLPHQTPTREKKGQSFFVAIQDSKTRSPIQGASWKLLHEALMERSYEDAYPKATTALYQIQEEIEKLNTPPTKEQEKILTNNAESIIITALQQFEITNKVKSDDPSKKMRNFLTQERFPYWIARAVVHILGSHIKQLDPKIFENFPCFETRIMLSPSEPFVRAKSALENTGREDALEYFKKPTIRKTVTNNQVAYEPWGISHPFVDATLAGATDIIESLTSRKPKKDCGEIDWTEPFEGLLNPPNNKPCSIM
jgi:hypothetical protein